MNLSTKKEVKQWVSEFAASSNIKYNTQGGYKRKGTKVIFAQWYICQCIQKKLSKQQQVEKDEVLKCKQKCHGTHASNAENSEKIQLLSNLCDKKTDCQSKMTVKIPTMQSLGNLCEVQLWWNHNHSVDSHHLTSFNPILLATKHKFYSYI